MTRYEGERLNRVAFPMGGIGAGMICLEGTGGLSHVSVRHEPEIFNEPYTYAAICVKGEKNTARLLEGPLPDVKKFGFPGAGNGAGDRDYGLPRFHRAAFETRFPFSTVQLADDNIPLDVELTGWSPFIPGNADDSSLPVAGLEYTFTNNTNKVVESVFSFNSRNVMATGKDGSSVRRTDNGFVMEQASSEDRPWDQGSLLVTVDAEDVGVDCSWFRGEWFDAQTVAWEQVASGEVFDQDPPADGAPSPGASLYVPLTLEAGESRTVNLRLAWYVPRSNVHAGGGNCSCESVESEECDCYTSWYSRAFDSIGDLEEYWSAEYDRMRIETKQFTDCFYDTTLPEEVVEAVAANLTILKSPTVLRQQDGRIWAWEGCCDSSGCCHGTCTHVWDYAQALPHLFPELERSMRWTDFHESQDENGHQAFRTPLPIREMGPDEHNGSAAADGQLGGIMRVYREWRISGDKQWLTQMWPRAKKAMDYCIETWDPDREGVLREPHHNTYDIEFWGPDGMCGSFYVGALVATARMARELGEDAAEYEELADKARDFLEEDLFNGEYFYQKVQWKDLHAPRPDEAEEAGDNYSPEALALLQEEGPKYQYGTGCLSDGVLGAWQGLACGLGDILDREKVEKHLVSVYRHNLKSDLSDHANPQRPTFALGDEGGLLLCSWPHGGKPTLPFVYSDEVWTGIEYQVASHLMMLGRVEEGLEIVRTCRDRYDGTVRNPFNEYECGHWYARAMASYAMLQGLSGARYDAVERVLYLNPSIEGDFRAFLCTETGYGTVGIEDGEPFIEVRSGEIEIERIVRG
ncbi:MAG: GH116 family glycosyl hydrolase [Candidatus Brocadiia bacterium]